MPVSKGAPNEIYFVFYPACGRAPAASRLGRFGFICAPSASRGHAVERAFHLLLNALNGAAADAALAGNLQHAFAGAQLSLDALFERGIDPRPTELLALRHSALQPSMHTLPDHVRSNSPNAPQT